jgi:hypothetical protein
MLPDVSYYWLGNRDQLHPIGTGWRFDLMLAHAIFTMAAFDYQLALLRFYPCM